ncbi:hypothetical protein EMIHUDRAFT_315415 [Emiliania huxleyi CCMP1516]|uniref:Uncharacterized protein n=2 Tax=Emiliania huxleyi TaxID=2903 RepID=A0A0D3IFB1_EMIH1|nr:hypothetical protein EMIHUDRAFT_437940 [Emiliania huxleyi CCMP1516]XP_005777176.1 hypothetical protein EMIHUDRAFT_315415 [Emiliania huxleyi CCMP1516]EOD09946.1 hypothetical protein EMIHUDRAFT_437940 [Emiliania huxleyi CCMP1516]EOD24747.1 hypothetical protein EMIHUDRAFT_315415 [Emiliania huxleyi CCMP1516]|eukprot:XP_005762375.1 hypothetical protein EMIHUDRAFT_437940 [Emiliania huxleyi CCMP1516]
MASEAQKAAWRKYEQEKRLPRKDNRDRGKRDRTRDQQARRSHKKAAAILAAIAQEGPLISMARSEAQKAAERNYEKKRGPRKRIDKRKRGKRDRTSEQRDRRARKKAAAIAERAQEAAEDAATAAAAVDNEAAPASDSAAPALDVQDAALEM